MSEPAAPHGAPGTESPAGGEILDLPAVVGGRLLWSRDAEHTHTLDYDSGVTVRMPALTAEHVEAAARARGPLLRELGQLTIHDVTSLFSRVAARWLDPAYAVRRDAEADAARLTGFAPRMIGLDYNFMGYVLRERTYIYDYVESELGHERILDEWMRVKACWVRAFPRGVAVHSMVGNVPMANGFSLLWGLMTRNLNVAKVPARDPVTPIALARAFVDTDPEHPLTRGLTVGYWAHASEAADAAYRAADVVLAWGGATALKQIKERVAADVPLVEFGPKWSLAVIDLDRCDPDIAASRMAADVTFYDQEACLSPQRVFVKGDTRPFVARLRHYLEKAAAHIPKESRNRDALAHVALSRLEFDYRGWTHHEGSGWTLVETDEVVPDMEHPLGRTLFVHRVRDLSQVTGHLTPSAQTLCVEPWEIGVENRDAWALAGADRIVELGMSRRPQAGYVHDAMRPLSRLVRWATVEQGVHDFYKYGDFTADAVERRLFPWWEPPGGGGREEPARHHEEAARDGDR